MYKLRGIGNKGITLIALVVTIVILLILAGISINAITGDNGIVSQAQEAKIETELSSVEEAYNIYLVKSEKNNMNGTDFSKVDFLTKVFIGDDQYVYAVNDLDKLNLDMDSGKGTIKTAISKYEDLEDVYFVDEEGHAAYIKDGILYGSVNTKEGIRETAEDFFEFDEATGTIVGIVENTSKDPNGIGYYYDKHYNRIISEEKVVIPSQINGVTVEEIGEKAFSDCGALKSIKMPDTIKKIGRAAFIYCKGLTEIIIPEKVEFIGYRAFRGCTGLTSIRIPASVKTMERGEYDRAVFGFNCTNLTSIVLGKGSTLEIPDDKWGAPKATVTREQ